MRAKLSVISVQTSRFILKFIFIFAVTLAVFSTLSSIILNARPIADDYGHITYFSKAGVIDYARGFYMGTDSHPLSVIISTLINLLLSSIGLVPGYALLVTVQILLFLILATFLISHSVQLNRKSSGIFLLASCALLLLILTLNFSGSTSQSPYRSYGLIGWVNFFWQHVPLNLLQVLLFLRWRRNLWLKKDTVSCILVFLLAIWGPLESLTTLGMFVFITLFQFKKMKFSLFKTNNLEFYFSFIILFIASVFTFFSPSSSGRRHQYSSEIRIGNWYERFVAYNLLSFREIVVYGIFAAFLSSLIGFILGYKKLLFTNKLSFWNLIFSLISLVLCINFAETFSYFAPFHHTIFSFVFVLTTFVGGVELGMRMNHIRLWVQAFLIFTILFSVIAFYSPASNKAFNYRQTWDANQVQILSKCTNDIYIPGVSGFLPGSSMNPDWNIWSCRNRNWFDGISNSVGSTDNVSPNSMARVLNLGFNNSLNFIMNLIYGGHLGGSNVIEKFDYYGY